MQQCPHSLNELYYYPSVTSLLADVQVESVVTHLSVRMSGTYVHDVCVYW